MVRKLKERLAAKAASPGAMITLAAVSFVESSFFPIPPDIMVIPMALLKPKEWKRIAMVCTAASVAGGLLGYLIGYHFFDMVAARVIAFYDAQHHFDLVSEFYNRYDFFAVFAAGLTPIPYKVFTIAAGLFKMNILSFTLASLVGRGLRFFLEAWLVSRYGERAVAFMEKHWAWTTVALTLLVLVVILTWRAL